jgi:hypothetical protein
MAINKWFNQKINMILKGKILCQFSNILLFLFLILTISNLLDGAIEKFKMTWLSYLEYDLTIPTSVDMNKCDISILSLGKHPLHRHVAYANFVCSNKVFKDTILNKIFSASN